ncbi:MAG: lycopene cyclase domain-containing protein [Candidatus Saccharimonadales bacterium]
MIGFTYLTFLVFGIVGVSFIDRRYKLAYWCDRAQTLRTLAICIGVFIVWDVLGIALGIFFHGNSNLSLPVRLLPEFPIEELFFLTLLCYSTLVIYQGISRKW